MWSYRIIEDDGDIVAKTVKPVGRPKRKGPPLVMVNFKADPATVAAIDLLTDMLPGVVGGGRSLAIRAALVEAAARITSKKRGK